MPSGFVAILTAELHFPEASSLKGKRHHLRSAKDNLRNRFGAAVAEVDHHDLWQRATLTAAFVGADRRRRRAARRRGRALAGLRRLGARPLRPPAALSRRLVSLPRVRAHAQGERIGPRRRRGRRRRAQGSADRHGHRHRRPGDAGPRRGDGLLLGARQREEAARNPGRARVCARRPASRGSVASSTCAARPRSPSCSTPRSSRACT